MPIKLKPLIEVRLKSLEHLKALVPKFVLVAQKVYDGWIQDENDELNGGGICQNIADEISGVCNMNGIDATTVSAQVGEQHVWCVAKVREGIFEIDIPPSVYETGGGYTWKKIPDVKFDANDIYINRLSSDPNDFDEYTEY